MRRTLKYSGFAHGRGLKSGFIITWRQTPYKPLPQTSNMSIFSNVFNNLITRVHIYMHKNNQNNMETYTQKRQNTSKNAKLRAQIVNMHNGPKQQKYPCTSGPY